ncbi:MAG: zinc ribbon domain-containing protein [Smithellaceae bacterium]|nr:zinc ribbon domain-containing protein [Smithellaceae bacterium]
MPIYTYECGKCAHRFDVIQKIGEGNEMLVCPRCAQGKPDKIIAPFRTNAWSSFLDGMERKVSPHKFK